MLTLTDHPDLTLSLFSKQCFLVLSIILVSVSFGGIFILVLTFLYVHVV